MAKILIYDKLRVNGGTNIDYPRQRWVPKLVIYRFRTGCVRPHWRDLNLHHDTSFIPLQHTQTKYFQIKIIIQITDLAVSLLISVLTSSQM